VPDVIEPDAVALIGGSAFPVVGWSVDGDLTTDLPEQVRDVAGSAIAACRLELTSPSGSAPGWWSPWRRRSLVGETVTVQADDGSGLRTVFTGTVRTEQGSTGQASASFDCLDVADRLHMPVTLAALPAEVEGVVTAGLSPSWVIDRVARQAGFQATYPNVAGSWLSATCAGSVWPETGTLVATSGLGFGQAGWGVACTAGTATWQVSRPRALVGVNTLGWSAEGDGTAVIRVRLATTDGDQDLTVTYNGGGVTVSYAGTVLSGTQATAANVLTLTRTSAASMAASWGAGAGNLPIPASATVRAATLTVNNAAAGGIVFHPGQPAAYLANSRIDEAVGHLDAVPPIGQTSGWDIVRDIAAAEQGAVWVDPDGTFRFASRLTLRGVGATPVEVTSERDLASLAWTVSDSQLAGTVEVPVALTTVVTSLDGAGVAAQTVPVWTADQPIRINPQRTVRLLVDLDGGAYGLDTVLRTGDDGSSWYRANTRRDGAGTSVVLASARVVQVGPSQARITLRNSSGARLWLVDSNGDPALRLTARARVDQDDSFAVDHDNGTGHPEVLRLPDSPWRQDEDAAETQARWLASEVASPTPQIRDVQVVPDLARSRGDIVRLIDGHASGADLRAVVTGIRLSGTAGLLEQSLTLRPTGTTYAEFAERYAGLTFADFAALWSGRTYADFATDPLEPV
jgi:hypothetical protein